MIFDHKKDIDTTNVYNAIIKVIESRAPDINDTYSGVSHLVVYRLEGEVDLELHGYCSSAYLTTQFILQRVSFNLLQLQRNLFTKEQIDDLDDRFDSIVKSRSCKTTHFALVDKIAQDILNNIN